MHVARAMRKLMRPAPQRTVTGMSRSGQFIERPASRALAADVLLRIVAIACVGQLFLVAVGDHSYLRGLFSAAGRHDELASHRQWLRVDQVVAAAPGGGNLAMQLHDVTHHSEAVSGFYHRAVYTLWPRRIYAAGRGFIVNGGEQLREGNRRFMAESREQLNIRGVVHLSEDDGGLRVWSTSR